LFLAVWATESSLEVMLAANRCLELLCTEHVVDALFKGWRTWMWMAVPTAYGLYIFFFEKPIVFSGLYSAWLFNPHVGYANISMSEVFFTFFCLKKINFFI
jgi:hypothetical protein